MWLAMGVGATSCRFDLPQVVGPDAPGNGPLQLPRCIGLAATCGLGANEDCCQAAEVPGGTFYRSYDVATDDYNDMGYPANVSTFVLDKYEVTVGRFRAFVNAGMGTQTTPPGAGAGAHSKLAGSGWNSSWNTNLVANTDALTPAIKCDTRFQTWTDAPGANENKPMNCVNWYEAIAFCIWDGGYLPTEAEWNYAASGGGEQRAFPWSSPASSRIIDCTYANYKPGTYCVNDPTGAANRVGSESPMGDGKWQHSDLAGNVWEWTLDWFAPVYSTQCDDCANLTASSERVYRGGYFLSDALSVRGANRGHVPPSDRYVSIGLRCARTP